MMIGRISGIARSVNRRKKNAQDVVKYIRFTKLRVAIAKIVEALNMKDEHAKTVAVPSLLHMGTRCFMIPRVGSIL